MKLNKRKLTKIHDCLVNTNSVILVLLFVFINIILSMLLSFLSRNMIDKYLTNGSGFKSIKDALLMGVIMAPLIETFIFQYAIIETVKKKNSLLIACIVSAFVFAILHWYNFYYFLFAFVSGMFLAYLYCLGKTIIKGLLLVLSAHALYNLFVFTITYL